MDYSSLMQSMMGIREDSFEGREENRVYTNDISTEMMKTMLSELQTNNLSEFKQYIESNPDNILDSISEIQYSYSPSLYIYGRDLNDNILRVNPSTVMEAMMGESMANTLTQMDSTYSSLMGGGMSMSGMNVWNELLGNDIIKNQYEVLAGRLPERYSEVVLIVNEHNELSDVTLYALGLRDQSELNGMMASIMAGESFDLDTGDMSFGYDELLDMSFRLLIPSDFYGENGKGGYDNMSKDEEFMAQALEDAPEIKVVGIVRPDGDSLLTSANKGGI